MDLKQHPEYQHVKEEVESGLENIPGYMHEPILDYVLHGGYTGDFLTAVFSDSLIGAFQRADDNNMRVMREYAMLLYRVPIVCKGSPEAVKEWQELGGLVGLIQGRADKALTQEQTHATDDTTPQA